MDDRNSQRNPNRNYVNRAELQRDEQRPASPFQRPRPDERGDVKISARETAQSASQAAPKAFSEQSAKRSTAPKPPKLPPVRRLMLRRWLVLGVITVMAVAVVVFVNNVLHVGKLTEDIERLKKEQDKLLQQNELYRTEIIRLQAPNRITTIARERLGMVSASSAPKTISSSEQQ